MFGPNAEGFIEEHAADKDPDGFQAMLQRLETGERRCKSGFTRRPGGQAAMERIG